MNITIYEGTHSNRLYRIKYSARVEGVKHGEFVIEDETGKNVIVKEGSLYQWIKLAFDTALVAKGDK